MVSFEEISDSPQLTISAKATQISAVRKFLIDWADYPTFITQLLGGWSITGTGAAQSYPPSVFPGWPQLLADNVNMVPFDDAVQSQTISNASNAHNAYTKALVTVNYKPFVLNGAGGNNNRMPGEPDVPDGTFLDLESEAASEMLTLPGHTVFWYTSGAYASNPVDSNQNAGIEIGCEEFRLTWSRVPNPPWSIIQAAVGLLNNASFLGYGTRQVIFQGCSRKRSFQIQDKNLWTLTYKFKCRSIRWDYFYRSFPAAKVGFDKIVDASGADILGSTTFNNLFKFGS
jgi:hypothetical protein